MKFIVETFFFVSPPHSFVCSFCFENTFFGLLLLLSLLLWRWDEWRVRYIPTEIRSYAKISCVHSRWANTYMYLLIDIRRLYSKHTHTRGCGWTSDGYQLLNIVCRGVWWLWKAIWKYVWNVIRTSQRALEKFHNTFIVMYYTHA